MKRIIKILKWTGLSVVVILLVLTIVVASRQHLKFDAPYPQIKASGDSAVIAQGKYLFYGAAHCTECHTNPASFPGITDRTQMSPSGGKLFQLPVGKIYSPNITSDKETGIGNMSDEAIARTLRYGVGSDGRALVDFMPFHNMSDEDLQAVISYLRTIPPVKNKVPDWELNIAGKAVKAFLITPVGPSGEIPVHVDREPNVAYGKYLANSVGNCNGCHTNRNLMTGAAIGPEFADGLQLESEENPKEIFVTRNLTPDKTTGQIYDWSEEQFINRFRAGRLIKGSPMPWEAFKNMSDNDLKAIYRYLHTIQPVKNNCGPPLFTSNEQ